jgi:hypothetical protein
MRRSRVRPQEDSVEDQSLNLTPHRGPSVWDEPQPHATPLHLAAAATGLAITAMAWRAAPPRRFWIAGLGAAGAMAALMSGRLGDRAGQAMAAAKARRQARGNEPLDRTLKETFPASDSPAVW